MSDRQLLLIILAVTLLTLGVIVELGKNRITSTDLAVFGGFVAGVGFVIAFMRGGPKK